MILAPDRPPEAKRPIYWFAVLDLSLARGDLAAAAEAVRELRALGIDVRYRGLRPRRRKAGAR